MNCGLLSRMRLLRQDFYRGRKTSNSNITNYDFEY